MVELALLHALGEIVSTGSTLFTAKCFVSLYYMKTFRYSESYRASVCEEWGRGSDL